MSVLVAPRRFKRSTYNGVGRGVHNGVRKMDDGIPRTGLIFYARAPGMVDTIGLSASDYLSVPAELRSIFYIDENTLRPTADAYALARVSEYLNMVEMVGRGEGKGIALYTDGTAEATLIKACRYFGVTFGEQYFAIDLDGKSVFGTPDIGAYEY